MMINPQTMKHFMDLKGKMKMKMKMYKKVKLLKKALQQIQI